MLGHIGALVAFKRSYPELITKIQIQKNLDNLNMLNLKLFFFLNILLLLKWMDGLRVDLVLICLKRMLVFYTFLSDYNGGTWAYI